MPEQPTHLLDPGAAARVRCRARGGPAPVGQRQRPDAIRQSQPQQSGGAESRAAATTHGPTVYAECQFHRTPDTGKNRCLWNLPEVG